VQGGIMPVRKWEFDYSKSEKQNILKLNSKVEVKPDNVAKLNHRVVEQEVEIMKLHNNYVDAIRANESLAKANKQIVDLFENILKELNFNNKDISYKSFKLMEEICTN
jgi:hypothetical protein